MKIPREWIELRGQLAAGIVLDSYAAVYIPIPKVACTSLKTAVSSILEMEGDVHFEKLFREVANHEIRATCSDHYIFTFVRNPWDRLLSCYLSKIDPREEDCDYWHNGVEFNFWKYGDTFDGGMSFEAFVRATAQIPDEEADIHFSSQYRHITAAHGSLIPDFIGRFESLADDFSRVLARLDLTKMSLPHQMKTEHQHYSAYYTDETRALVRGRYATDIELFGYTFQNRSGDPVKLPVPRA